MIYQLIITAHEAAAKAIIPTKKKTKKQLPWVNSDVNHHKSVVKEKHEAYISKPSIENKTPLSNILDNLKAVYDNNRRAYIESYISETS